MVGRRRWARSASACAALAGRCKERDLREQQGGPGEFSWLKGLLLSLVAGVLSAVYGIAINDVAKPIIATAEQLGAGYWKGNIGYLFVNPGAFLTALVYSLYLARRNRSLGELLGLGVGQPAEQPGHQLRPGHAHRHALVRAVLLLQSGPRADGFLRVHQLGHPHDHAGVVQQRAGRDVPRMERLPAAHPLGHRAGPQVLLVAVLLLTYGNYLGDLAAS